MPKSETVITYTKQEIEDLVRADVRKNLPGGASTMEISITGAIQSAGQGRVSSVLEDMTARVSITDMKPVKKSA